jgi:hypothetical protein
MLYSGNNTWQFCFTAITPTAVLTTINCIENRKPEQFSRCIIVAQKWFFAVSLRDFDAIAAFSGR